MFSVLLIACQPMPVSGEPLSPARVSTPVAEPAPAPANSDAADDENDAFDEEEEFQEEELVVDPIALLALQQGVEIPPPAPMLDTQADLAIPENTLPDASVDWGMRLVSTLHNVQPPRAILGLPDGTEAVVTAGTILADQGAVVMAIGHQTIEVAYITPAGYQAKVETRRITALYPE